jgi:hypothetical protein
MTFPASYPIIPIHPSPKVKWQNGNLTATRTFKIQSEFVDDFIGDLLSRGDNCGLPTSFPNWPLVMVDSIDAEPMSACAFVTPTGEGLTDPSTELEGYPSELSSDDPGFNINGPWWKVTVNYATKQVITGQDNVREGTWVTYEADLAGTVERLPNNKVFYMETGEAVRDDAGSHVLVCTQDINIKWNFIDESDFALTTANLKELQNTVNDDAYGAVFFPMSGTDIYEPETLLFLGASTSLEAGTRSMFGTYCVALQQKRTLSLKFKYKRVTVDESIPEYGGWNHRLYAGFAAPNGYKRVSLNPTVDVPVYRRADFQTMFL